MYANFFILEHCVYINEFLNISCIAKRSLKRKIVVIPMLIFIFLVFLFHILLLLFHILQYLLHIDFFQDNNIYQKFKAIQRNVLFI